MRSSRVLSKKQQPRTLAGTVIHGVCGHCATGCGLQAFPSGATTDFFGDAEHPANKGALCPKALSLYTVQTDPLRLHRPCMRAHAGQDWVAISWEAALDAIAQTLENHWASPAIFPCGKHEPFDYYQGASWFASLLPSAVAPAHCYPRALGSEGALAAMFGLPGTRLLMNTPRDWAMSRAILLVGGDVAAEEPIAFGPLQDFRDRGGTLLYLGSAGGMTALRSSEALLVAPGTESTALAGLVHCFLASGHINTAFLKAETSGLETLRALLASFTPERVAATCGVTVAQLRIFADILGHTFPIQVQTAFATQYGADDALLTLCGALVALRGSIGIPGGGLNLHGATPFRGLAAMPTQDQNLGDQSPYETLLSNPDSLVFGFGDWSAQFGNGSEKGLALQKTLARSPLVVHMGCFDDATRQIATVSLPLAHWSEYAHLADVNNGRALQWTAALHEPPAQCRTPLEVWAELARRMNKKALPPWHKKSHTACQQRNLAVWALANEPLTQGLQLDDLDDANLPSGGVLWPCPAGAPIAFEHSRYIKGTVRGANILFMEHGTFPGSKTRFPTQDGKIHLECVQVPLPESSLTRPETGSTEGAAGQSPLTLLLQQEAGKACNQPPPFRYGTRKPLAKVHPMTARQLGLATGQPVLVRAAEGSGSDPGTGLAAALQATWSVPPGSLVLDPDAGLAPCSGQVLVRPADEGYSCITILTNFTQ